MAPQTETGLERAASKAASVWPHRLLIADTDPALVESVRDLLREREFEVLGAESTEAAWQLYREGRVDTVICAWPGNAPDHEIFLRRLRDEERNDRAHVIVIGDSDTIDQGLACGADDFLVRPFAKETLLARLRVAERIHRLRDDVSRQHLALSDTNRQLEEANEKIHYELRAAARVQQALLPSRRLSVPGMSIGWRVRPCEELAGDILNCVKIDEHQLGFYVLDVSGHGVSSALMSVQVSRMMSPLMADSTLLKEPLKEPPWYRLVEPVRVLRRLNQVFRVTDEIDQYFTMIYGRLHLESGRLSLASAGHPPPILSSASGEATTLDCPGHPVGFFDEPDFGSLELVLEPGQRLWLYSDGVVDAEDRRERILEFDGLRRMISANSEHPVEDAIQRIMAAVEHWVAPATPDDDCSLLVIERNE